MLRDTQQHGGEKVRATLRVFRGVAPISPRGRWVIAYVCGGGRFRLTGQLAGSECFVWLCSVPVTHICLNLEPR